jgi:ubiquinone/menaquinone biosynthesis C-methylase UbiE
MAAMRTQESDLLPGVHLSPNIQGDPDLYEVENQAVDPEQLIEAAMRAICPWEGKVVLDLGAGTGFHIQRFHERAQHVFAVEPHGLSRVRAMARVAGLGLERVSIAHGSAEQLPLRDRSVDIVHSRFAYFYPPDCEPGLVELERVIRPGGAAFIVDNDLRTGTFTSWLQRSPWVPDNSKNANLVEKYWADHGFTATRIPSEWRFKNRADFEAVVRIEFPPELADQILAEHDGTVVDCHYVLWHRRYRPDRH